MSELEDRLQMARTILKLEKEVERLRTIVKNSPLPPGELRYRQLADGRVKDCVTGEVLEE